MTQPDASLQAAFDQAVTQSKSLSERPDNASLLQLYALFKQASEGDVTGEKPGAFDFVALAKWNARAELRGTGRADAMRRYIDLVERLRG
jgi:diazepam-binding inhibitor (GABA receptor modulating acyl-CoA-binding protein)